jgi:exoribonuclease R
MIKSVINNTQTLLSAWDLYDQYSDLPLKKVYSSRECHCNHMRYFEEYLPLSKKENKHISNFNVEYVRGTLVIPSKYTNGNSTDDYKDVGYITNIYCKFDKEMIQINDTTSNTGDINKNISSVKISSLYHINRSFNGDSVLVKIFKKDDPIIEGMDTIVYSDCESDLGSDLSSDCPMDNKSYDEKYYGTIISNYTRVPVLNSSNPIQLVGTLTINSKKKYGVNKKGMPIYKFKPHDRHFPPFLVPSSYLQKHKGQGQEHVNIYVLVTFKCWETNMRYPHGTCEHVFGPIDVYSSNFNMLLRRYKLIYRPYKIDKVIAYMLENNIIPRSHGHGRKVYDKNKCIVSIDPIGCKDIDDAINVWYDEGKSDIIPNINIDVHIADVSHYIREGSWIDIEARKRGSSLYLSNNDQVNMIPDKFALDVCSLHCNKESLAMTCSMSFDLTTGKLQRYNFYESVVYPIASLTYDQANSILHMTEIENDFPINNTSTCKQLSIDLQNICKLAKYRKEEGEDETEGEKEKETKEELDSHDIVEFCMVMANHCAASQLSKTKLTPIYRIHQSKDSSNVKSINTDDRVSNFMKILMSNSAQYVTMDRNEKKQTTYHHGLNIDMYTHFTSPIRRYIDIVVHRMIKQSLKQDDIGNNTDTENNQLCTYINQKNKDIKQCERLIAKLDVIYKENGHGPGHKITDKHYEAYVIEISESRSPYNIPVLTLYIPDLGITEKCEIYSKMLHNLLHTEFVSDKDQNHEKNIGCTPTSGSRSNNIGCTPTSGYRSNNIGCTPTSGYRSNNIGCTIYNKENALKNICLFDKMKVKLHFNILAQNENKIKLELIDCQLI